MNIFFNFTLKNQAAYSAYIKNQIQGDIKLINFKIDSIYKVAYLESENNTLMHDIDFEITNLSSNLFIKKITPSGEQAQQKYFEISKENDAEGSFEELNEEKFKEFFEEATSKFIELYRPRVNFWGPTDKYLLDTQDLNVFKEDTNSNIPLRNIFGLAGFKDSVAIKREIDNALSNEQSMSKLKSKLTSKTTQYVKRIWKHDIKFIIEIESTGKLITSIRDGGAKNEHDRYKMTDRSDGFKHFMSLILSLSIENDALNRSNRLILIDEPEIHLHPSAIRDLGKELVKLGKNNFVFVATHSPFLIDKKHKNRNVIVKKNDDACTDIARIKNEDDLLSDEVLKEAFGINVYKDLMNPHSILVEGFSDKLILDAVIQTQTHKKISVTNGTGSNIVSIVSKFNHEDISILVIVDDDREGQKYKQQILKINSNLYSAKNVFTIRDLVGDVKNGGTIEDLLGKEFVEDKFKFFFKEVADFSLDEHKPFIQQIKIFLQRKNMPSEELKEKLNKFKKALSDDFHLTKISLSKKFPLLKSLADKIQEKFEQMPVHEASPQTHSHPHKDRIGDDSTKQ